MNVLLKRERSRHLQLRYKKTKAATFLLSIFLLFFVSSITYAQNNLLVKGRITTETGEPIPGASVTVKGSTNGVTTNDNGAFEINAPARATLVVSSVGYAPQEIKVN